MGMGWIKAAAGAAVSILGLTAPSAHADDWLKERQTRFAAYQAAHPNPDAEIAEIKAKTAALIAAYRPPPSAPKYADLYARSALMTPAQKAQAVQMFVTAQGLWKTGDFASAKEGFAQGLEIDPANGPANFYMGDILQRQGDAARAGLYMDRAATLAPGTAEAFKAAAALRNLTPPDTDPALDRAPAIWRASDGPVELWDGADYPEMMVVPAGEYTMGSPVTEANHDKGESPRHRVRIGYSFAVGKYPITVGEFARFVADSHYDAGDQCYTLESGDQPKGGRNLRRPSFDQASTHPAVCINYNDAQAYAVWLSKKTGHAYRLLTEAEYEYANRAGTNTAYWWGNDPATACAYANGGDLDTQARYQYWNSGWIANTCHDGFVVTSPVGSFKPNPFGLYDTTGNAWSWLSDCWNDNYNSAPTDGSASSGGDCGQRGLRGGSWYCSPALLRAAQRYRNSAGDRYFNVGFRLARTL